MCSRAEENSWNSVLEAEYRKSWSRGTHRADSQLVHQLRQASWVPQGNQFVRPAFACAELLPEGFSFDPGSEWLKAVKFGEEVANKTEQQRQKKAVARELGFEDSDSLHDGQEFVALLSPQERKEILEEIRARSQFDLPEREPSNPERRAQRVGAMATDAPDRRTEVRNRSVSIGVGAVKEEAGQYLGGEYTNPDGEMICQVCKSPLPFKLDDGSAYFERVQFLKELKKHHHQNYLALCPNHAAMFLYANGSSSDLKDMVHETVGNEVRVILARRETAIYFTKRHLADLRTLIEVEEKQRGSESEVN